MLCKLRLLRTYESHYEQPKRHNHLVSAKYGVAKFSYLNFALHIAYMPSRHLRRLDTPLQAPKHLAEWDIGILIASA